MRSDQAGIAKGSDGIRGRMEAIVSRGSCCGNSRLLLQ